MKKISVGVLGATGMVGQRFISLLAHHPWFEISVVAASPKSAGKTYGEAVNGKWRLASEVPENVRQLTTQNVSQVNEISDKVDFVFCAAEMEKGALLRLEEDFARHETPVISNTGAHRWTTDVPVIIPEVNLEHARIIPAQRRRLGTKRGFIASKPNCSVQSYVPALAPLRRFGVQQVAICTYQAVSGAAKTLQEWPEIQDNVIPFIAGEEEKSENEPLKIFGFIRGERIFYDTQMIISAQCVRVPVNDGHLAAVSVNFTRKPTRNEIMNAWQSFEGLPQLSHLPSAPKKLLHYLEGDDRPQPNLDRNLENGMAIALGRLREDRLFDYRFICLSHNTIRGAAGGAILTAEALVTLGYLANK